MIPAPLYTLINTSKGNDPAVVVVNSALENFSDKQVFPWHLKISIDCKLVGNNGMPTAEEGECLQQLEREIESTIQSDENAIFLARVTCRSQRTLLFRVRNPEVANTLLQSLTSSPRQIREWDYVMERDSEWRLAQPELGLLKSS